MIRIKFYYWLALKIKQWRDFWASPYSGFLPEVYWILLFKAKRLENKNK